MKTLLYLIFSFTFILSSCSTSSRSYSYKSKHKKSRKYKAPKSSSTYSSNSKRKNSSTSKKTKRAYRSTEYKNRNGVTTYAENFKGTPYVYGGKNTSGFDCSGFITHVYNDKGFKLAGNSRTLATMGRRKSLSKAQQGDLIFFGKSGKVSHVAIVVKNTPGVLEVIHATSSRGVVRENISGSTYWTPRILFVRDVISDTSLAAH